MSHPHAQSMQQQPSQPQFSGQQTAQGSRGPGGFGLLSSLATQSLGDVRRLRVLLASLLAKATAADEAGGEDAASAAEGDANTAVDRQNAPGAPTDGRVLKESTADAAAHVVRIIGEIK